LQLDTEITGSTSEPDGTLITVLLNGVVVGTDTAEDGGFSVVLSAPVEAGDIITATAAAACELESAASTPAVVGYKDTDGDTINDVDEQEGDADDDDTDNFLDLDSDGDGIADSVEAGDDDVATEPVDTDGDGVPDFLDPDSDDDGKPDEEEGTGDQDGDGKPNYIDPDDNDGPLGDADGDTITNEDEDFTDLDTDGDETPDYLDLDSDDDGIPDKTEAGDGDLDTDPVDSDGDETPDFQDEDSDDDGLTDEEETAEDCDGDTVPNYLDLDSDDDGKPDSEEGTDDSDGDGIADFCDPDIFDPEGDDDGDTIKNGDDGQADADGDGKPNYLDTDADGDGVGDAEEAGDDDLGTPPVDTDGDGTPDFLDLDADNDTITDTDEMAEDYPGNVVPNADGDGLPNFRDLDSDGDGLPDAEEAGDSVLETAPIDTDGDGIPNFLDLDSDGDGVPDSLDNCVLAQNADQADSDLDSVGDVCDNCPEFPNADQLDSDLNGVGDVCDIDVLPDEDDGFVGALYGGGGCRTPAEDSRGLGALAALGTAALMLGIRRRRRLRRLTLATGNEGGKQVTLWLAVTLCLSLPSNNAHAQGVNAQNFVPAAGKGNQVVTHGSDTGQHLDFSIGFLADYSKNPLVLVFGDREESVVEHLVTGNFLFSLSTWDFMQFAIGIPVNLALIGTYEGSDLAPATMGDISLDIKFRILDHQKMGGFGLALVPTITFPTGNKDEFSGAGTFGGLLRLVMDYRVWRIHTALNLGYGVQGDGSLRNVSFGSELFFNLGVGYNVIDPLTITAEIWGATRATDPFANDAESPLEGILSIKGAIADGVYLLGGGGAGFSVGVGSPDFRAFIGAGWAPEVRDTDGDGLVDSEDACPLQPEDFDGFEDSDGCPELDNDKDGIPDTSDGCPNEPEDVDGFQDEDGCPDGDNDNDGIADARDKCPRDPEDYDGFEDENGCPDPDNDGDSIPDVVDKCPLQPEVFNGVEDQDGCPDEALIELRDDYIQIKDKVYFDFNKDTIQERSFEMLNQIASLLSGQGNIGLVLVGGHTDGKGSDVYNLNLSQRRADAVVRYLVGRGVAPNRLRGQGFGETQPVAGNDTEEGREKNRRVEFLILEQGQR
jgi:outer membrane protein OmpA-like peptidoglycan-associated protein